MKRRKRIIFFKKEPWNPEGHILEYNENKIVKEIDEKGNEIKRKFIEIIVDVSSVLSVPNKAISFEFAETTYVGEKIFKPETKDTINATLTVALLQGNQMEQVASRGAGAWYKPFLSQDVKGLGYGAIFKKIDKETNKPMSDLSFDIYRIQKADGTKVNNYIGSFVSNKDGIVKTRTNLNKDETYEVREVNTPLGYKFEGLTLDSSNLKEGKDLLPENAITVYNDPGHTNRVQDISGEKIWDDKGYEQARPQKVTIELMQNGKKYQEKTVTATNNWKFTFSKAPIRDEKGELIKYTVKEEKLKNYTPKVEGFNITNTFDPKALVQVKYQDENGREIYPAVEIFGEVGESFKTEQKVISGYIFKSVNGPTEGEFTKADQEVVYTYIKKPEKAGIVTVKYQDIKGNEVHPEVNFYGNVGESFKTEQKVIDGYVFKSVNGPTEGKFEKAEQEVVYTYIKLLIPDSSTPDSSTPDSSTPDSSTPDSSTPDSSTPDSSTPDSSTPDSSTPDSSTPDSSTPDSSTPDSSTPDSSTPDSSTPDSSTPDSSTPDSSTPDSSTPDSSTPDSSTPDSSTPDSSTPDSSTPDSSTPDSSTPDSSTPDSSTPDSSTPDSSTPDSSTPDSSTPDSSTPDSSTPDSSTPDSSTPDSSTPDSSTPDSSTPDSSTPDSSTPDSSTPDSSTPDSSTPDSSTPDSSTPDSSTPDSSTPDSSTPDSSTPDSSTPDSDVIGSKKDTSILVGKTSSSNSSDSGNSQKEIPQTGEKNSYVSILLGFGFVLTSGLLGFLKKKF